MNRLLKKKHEGSVVATSPVIGERVVSEQEIREKAYHIYKARSGGYGSPLADWLEAEQEFDRRSSTRLD